MPKKKTVAILLSADSFENFFTGQFGITREQFGRDYQNDFSWQYSNGLSSLGHNMFIYVYSFGRDEVRKVSEGVNVRFVQVPFWVRAITSLLYKVKKIRFFERLRQRIPIMATSGKLNRALADDHVQTLYIQEIWTHRFDALIKSMRRVSLLGVDNGAPVPKVVAKSKIKFLKRAEALIVQSTDQVDMLKAEGINSILLKNGVDVNFFTPSGSDFERKSLLMVGRLVEDQKRISDVIKALQVLTDFKLTIVGEGPDRAELERLAGQIEGRVKFVGFVSDKATLREYYRKADVYVSASSREAVQLTVLEAMSCECPVVCTRIPTFEELIQDDVNGRLVAIGNPDGLAEAIMSASQNRARLGKAARQTVIENYDSNKAYERISMIVEQH